MASLQVYAYSMLGAWQWHASLTQESESEGRWQKLGDGLLYPDHGVQDLSSLLDQLGHQLVRLGATRIVPWPGHDD